MSDLQRLLASAIAFLECRAQLAAWEFRDEKRRTARLLAATIVVVASSTAGVVFGGLALAFSVDPAHRGWVLASVAVVFLASAGIAAAILARALFRSSPPFSASLAELEKDRQMILGQLGPLTETQRETERSHV